MPEVSLSEVHGSVQVPGATGFFRRIFAVAGPAYLVSVGYMDPGNWATDIVAGSRYGYALLWVLVMSNLMAILLQGLSSRLGIVRGMDLAQACRAEYPKPVRWPLYILAEIAITATDLAEVLGSAIALKLLFGLPLIAGVLITAADSLLLLALSHYGIRKIEALIIGLVTLIAMGLFANVFLARPDWGGVALGLMPGLPDAGALFVSLGMLGATVMPHNLYLHSALVQTRAWGRSPTETRSALRLNGLDTAIALSMALAVNAAILIMAAAAFHSTGLIEVVGIEEAHTLLKPILGTFAPIAFAIALLASGQSSTITGTMAGQIVMEGFINVRIPPWIRRAITRAAAVLPAVLVIGLMGEDKVGLLLVLSQVILSLQLAFAVIPLIHLTADRARMGEFAVRGILLLLGWLVALVVVSLNGKLVVDSLLAAPAPWSWIGWPLVAALGVLLGYVTFRPWLPGVRGASAGVHAPAVALAPALEGFEDPVRRVAVALDFSGRDGPILREALRLFAGNRPHLLLLHVNESAAARFLGRDWSDAEARADQARLDTYAAELRNLGYEVDVGLGRGRPVQELARMANDAHTEVVVLGAHGHRLAMDVLLGTTADRLRHLAKGHVMVVRT